MNLPLRPLYSDCDMDCNLMLPSPILPHRTQTTAKLSRNYTHYRNLQQQRYKRKPPKHHRHYSHNTLHPNSYSTNPFRSRSSSLDAYTLNSPIGSSPRPPLHQSISDFVYRPNARRAFHTDSFAKYRNNTSKANKVSKSNPNSDATKTNKTNKRRARNHRRRPRDRRNANQGQKRRTRTFFSKKWNINIFETNTVHISDSENDDDCDEQNQWPPLPKHSSSSTIAKEEDDILDLAELAMTSTTYSYSHSRSHSDDIPKIIPNSDGFVASHHSHSRNLTVNVIDFRNNGYDSAISHVDDDDDDKDGNDNNNVNKIDSDNNEQNHNHDDDDDDDDDDVAEGNESDLDLTRNTSSNFKIVVSAPNEIASYATPPCHKSRDGLRMRISAKRVRHRYITPECNGSDCEEFNCSLSGDNYLSDASHYFDASDDDKDVRSNYAMAKSVAIEQRGNGNGNGKEVIASPLFLAANNSNLGVCATFPYNEASDSEYFSAFSDGNELIDKFGDNHLGLKNMVSYSADSYVLNSDYGSSDIDNCLSPRSTSVAMSLSAECVPQK